MDTNSNLGFITSVPIIGIQHEVKGENGEIEVNVEYFTLYPDKFQESLDDVEDVSLLALLDVVNSGSLFLANLRSKLPNETHLLGSLVTDENAKTFLNAMSVALDSDALDKLVVLKNVTSRDEYPISQTIM